MSGGGKNDVEEGLRRSSSMMFLGKFLARQPFLEQSCETNQMPLESSRQSLPGLGVQSDLSFMGLDLSRHCERWMTTMLI